MTAKLLHLARTSARHRLGERGALLARGGFYALILFVFSRLWPAVLEGLPHAELDPDHLVWYLAITEWIVLSFPPIHTDVEDEVRRGDLAYRLLRPVPYPLARLSESIGELVVRLASLAPVGFGLAYLLTGELPVAPARMLWLLPLGLAASLLMVLFGFAIGLTSLRLHDCRPIYWVWQKSAFVLGAMFVPLHLYPQWLQDLAWLTPFPSMLYAPGTVALGLPPQDAALALARLLAWSAGVCLLLRVQYRRAIARLEIGGG